MFIGFSKKLKALGGIRIGFGKRVSGAGGWILFLLFAILNLYWYMILGCMWMIYGICYMFYLPFKSISKAIKKKHIAKKNGEN